MTRWTKALIGLLILSASLFAVFERASAFEEGVPSFSVQRVARINDHGLATIEDSFTIKNNSSSPISSFSTGFHRSYTNDLKGIKVEDSEGNRLRFEADINATSSYYLIRVLLPKPVGFNETYRFAVTYIFANLIKFKDGAFTYEFTATPVVQFRGEYANVTVAAPIGSDFDIKEGEGLRKADYGGLPAVNASFKPLDPFMDKTLSLSYKSATQTILGLKRFEREITLQPEEGLLVADTYQFRNLAGTLTGVRVKLLSDATDVMAYDPVGPLWTSPRKGAEFTVAPRYPGGVKPGGSLTFTLKYKLPALLKPIAWWGRYNLTFEVISNVQDWVVDEVVVKVVMPEGFALESATLSPQSLAPISTYEARATFFVKHIKPFDENLITVVFRYSPFWASLKPLVWVAVLEVAAFASILTIRAYKPVAPPIAVPLIRLREFVKLYDEKLALRRELEAMERDAARGALTKHEFRRRRKAVEIRIGEIDKALMPLKAALKATHPRYDELVKRLDKAEAEAEVIKASMDQLTAQYRSGKMAKETYQTLLRDLQKRLDKAAEAVETTMVTLREEAG